MLNAQVLLGATVAVHGFYRACGISFPSFRSIALSDALAPSSLPFCHTIESQNDE